METYLRRFVAFPSPECATAVTLWAAHVHALSAFESTPRLAVLSPEPGSGKTRVLEVLELLVPRALFSLNSSTAALFRLVSGDDGVPTILLDEADTIFGPRAAKDHEDLRGFINAGHRRGAQAHRCVVKGKAVEVDTFPAYAPVAMAGLDDLPDTIMSRSVVIRMRRRAPGERVEPFRHRLHAQTGTDLQLRLAAWMQAKTPSLTDAWPDMPTGIEDRAADVWEALLAVADAAGGDWPERARVSAVSLVSQSRGDGEAVSLNVRLLRDLRGVFTEQDADWMGTDELLSALHALEESPWDDLRGKSLDGRGLAQRLRKYDIGSHQIKAINRKGYRREDFEDAWSRYLPPPPEDSETSETSETEDPPYDLFGGEAA
ncbi:DUF3631 domain-containing protein [Aquipuribacter sp. SD81]|uniref:DUF3631 domain-containing protein n=1 Tax=Aquipuribacter sp. SD81 TaxID=3127703 RepID=UPI003016C3AC